MTTTHGPDAAEALLRWSRCWGSSASLGVGWLAGCGLTARAGLGAFTHGRARRAGFDGVGVPGLDRDPVYRG